MCIRDRGISSWVFESTDVRSLDTTTNSPKPSEPMPAYSDEPDLTATTPGEAGSQKAAA